MQAQMMVLLGAFQSGWDLALIVFGLHLFVLGILVFRSGKTGLRVVGTLVTAAGVGYLIDGVGKVLVPNYGLTVAMYTFVGEPLLMFWLLWKVLRRWHGVSVYGRLRRCRPAPIARPRT